MEGWVDLGGWICQQRVTHPSSNRARRRATALIETTRLLVVADMSLLRRPTWLKPINEQTKAAQSLPDTSDPKYVGGVKCLCETLRSWVRSVLGPKCPVTRSKIYRVARKFAFLLSRTAVGMQAPRHVVWHSPIPRSVTRVRRTQRLLRVSKRGCWESTPVFGCSVFYTSSSTTAETIPCSLLPAAHNIRQISTS